MGQAREQTGKDNRLGVKVNLLRRELHGLGKIAAGVMQEAAKCSGLLIFRSVGGLDKGDALFFAKKELLSLIVEKMRSRHFIVLIEKAEIEKASERGPFVLTEKGSD